jgi:prepilin-type N-terminal cleavage/methylation domain-containing protein
MSRARRAFTLLELSIVLAILGIAAIVVVPQFVGARFGNDPAPVAGDLVMGLMRSARTAAIQYGQTVTVHLDPTSGMYEVDTTGAYGTGIYLASTLEMSAWESISTDQPRLKFVFRPNGAAYGDSVLVHGQSGSAMVMPDPWSGQPLWFQR